MEFLMRKRSFALQAAAFMVASSLFALAQERLTTSKKSRHMVFVSALEILTSGAVWLGMLCTSRNPKSAPLLAQLKSNRVQLAILCFALAGSNGLGNAAMNYVDFVVKSIFRSSKLIPVMLASTLFTGKRYPRFEWLAAFIMVLGLINISMQASKASETSSFGIVLLSMSVVCDALVPVLQETLMNTVDYPLVMVVTGLGASSLLFLTTFLTGEIWESIHDMTSDSSVASWFTVYSALGIVSVFAFTSLVRHHGAVLSVVVALARKVISVALSHVIFPKPLPLSRLFGIILFFAGATLHALVRNKISRSSRPAQDSAQTEPDVEMGEGFNQSTSSSTNGKGGSHRFSKMRVV